MEPTAAINRYCVGGYGFYNRHRGFDGFNKQLAAEVYLFFIPKIKEYGRKCDRTGSAGANTTGGS